MATNYSPQEEALRGINPAATNPRGQPSAPQSSFTAPTNTYAPKTPLKSGKTSYTPGMGPGLTALATGVGGQIAGGQATQALTKGGVSALTGSAAPSWATGAAGMGAGMGISMAGNALANKLKPKEEMPITGGQHADILDLYGRRLEGAGPGAHGGAIRGATMGANPALAAATGGISIGVGALGGLIAGLATKNATSAYSDYSANDAYDAIGKGYQKYLGRDASEEEIMGRLRGQGYNPEKGHEYVGEKGLRYHMDEIASSPEAQAYLARQQAGGASTPTGAATDPQSSTTAPTLPAGNAPGTQGPLASTPGQSSYSFQTSQGDPATMERIRQEMGLGPYADPNYKSPAPGLQDTQAPTASPSGPPQLGQYALEGYDQGKLSSGHDSPKYLIGRTLSQFDPSKGLTPEAIQALNALGIGTFSGQGDKLSVQSDDPRFNGLSQFDVARDYTGEGGRTGSSAWQFSPDGPGAPGAESPQGAGGYSQQFQAPGVPQGGGYSSDVIRYLLSQMGLDRAATQMGG